MANIHYRAFLRLSILLVVFGLGCGMCDVISTLNSPKPTSRQVNLSDIATTMELSCITGEGQKQVTVHLNSDGALEIENPPSSTISGSWTIEQTEIYFHYTRPFVADVGTGWYIADGENSKFVIVQAVDPEACYWLDQP